MILSGRDYLESIRDGRTIYVGGEQIKDATTHPAFRGAAQTFAAIYDLKASPELRDEMTFEEGGERFSMHYLQPRTQEDLRRRHRAHRRITDFTLGLMGRTPDTVASSITGMTLAREVFERPGGYADNLENIYRHMRRNDVFCTYAIVPPQGARSKEFYNNKVRQPALQVTAEDDRGVTLNGMKMLATSAAYAHEVLIGNVMPLDAARRKEAITCVIPLNLPGLSLWARRPFNRSGEAEFDAPLTARYDESDCMLVFKDVHVPWEKVIVHDDAELSRNIYHHTPAHVIANHQCMVRFSTKMRTFLGMANLITRATGAHEIPAVREVLGRLAAAEAGFSAMVAGQIENYEKVGDSGVMYGRRELYGAIHWAMEQHSAIIDTLRELMGGGHFQFPADIGILQNEELAETFQELWASGAISAVDRMRVFKFAWDLIGSDLASRATSYEKFFVGPAFAVRNYNFIYTPWDRFSSSIEDAMARYDAPMPLGIAAQ
ncbi:4-hydroxyphenylacetate 3-hydroxylase N-terminal domain-containing protein [Bosea sp. TND4EK4]|uniref:4-hydroxyphenylacetate 3-hydroxylase family protein n=1 Tax=Bosea sp. TND4EK4 TaxID=1907408 RepID=UPI0009542B63|nr:4-hydroxyphenylacetate 3-hydroxylase N-terminal domain-containing protein [Bosea sp. TND4EK4]SIR46162.1 4-hydroxyphenylacetate 3-monooxygenase [Bosea sp. TND4EK4]